MIIKSGTFGEMQSQEALVETAATNEVVESVQAESAAKPEAATTTDTNKPVESTEAKQAESVKPENESDFTAPEFTSSTTEKKVDPFVPDWREAIKTNRDEVLKEAGLDPFVLELDKHIKNGGSAADYLQAKAFDYNKVPDAVLAKQALKNEFPNLSEDKIEKLFNKKYSQSDYDSDDEKEMGAILLEADAHKQRQSLIAEQARFKIPEAQQQQQAQQVDNSQIEAFRKFYAEHPQTKSLLDSKRVAVELADGVPFNFNIDKPEIVMQVITDGGETFERLTTTSTGEPDVAAKQEVALFTLNRTKFKADIYNYGLQQGYKKAKLEAQNIGIPSRVIADKQNEDPSAVWANARNSTFGG